MSDEISMINIDGTKIGLIGLVQVIDEIKSITIPNENRLKIILLEKLKIQNYVPPSKEGEYANALLREYKKSMGLPVEEAECEETVIQIRILGPGCSACDQMEQDVKSILAELNIAADVDHVRDINQIVEYGMVRTPSLVLNDKIVLNGRSLSKSQLKKLIENELL